MSMYGRRSQGVQVSTTTMELASDVTAWLGSALAWLSFGSAFRGSSKSG
jgi:hypothetical protein